jgi:hypothetical protein
MELLLKNAFGRAERRRGLDNRRSALQSRKACLQVTCLILGGLLGSGFFLFLSADCFYISFQFLVLSCEL